MTANRRKHPRVRARGVAANLRAQEMLKTGCLVENISAGGLLVRTDQTLEAGTPVVMDLVRPGMKKLLKLSGRVVGRVENVAGATAKPSGPGLRIQFDPMPDETTERLSKLLENLGLSLDPAVPAPTSGASPGSSVLPPGAPQIVWARPRGSPASEKPPAVEPGGGLEPPASLDAGREESAEPPRARPEPGDEDEDLAEVSFPGMDATQAMSEEAVRSALEAAEALATVVERPVVHETNRAALAPPPIMPLSGAAVSQGGDPAPPADTRLMVQIRGLLMELGEVQDRLESREREAAQLTSEVERLRQENRSLRERLSRAEERLRERSR